MKFKLDENLGRIGQSLLKEAGFEVSTVLEQDLCAVSDDVLIDICGKESRCLITLDLDFSNPLVYPPKEYKGIAVLRLPKRIERQHILDCLTTMLQRLNESSIDGKLWIVGPGIIREYHPDS